jgi:hypothetical protein
MELIGSLREKPRIGAIVAVCLICFAGLAILLELRPEKAPASVGVYFTVDDGKTWFADDAGNCPPFSHDGKPAVRCMIFNAGGSDFVGFLKKYSDSVRSKMLANIPCSDDEMNRGTLVKKPGDADWVPLSDPAGQKIVDVRDPNHPEATANPVLP